MSDILKIFIPTHASKLKEDDTFVPIQVGAEMHPDLDLCNLKDNVGDNISNMNGYYCELTAHYWLWKHAKEVYPNLKYIGFCHYRRFFDFGSEADKILNNPDEWFGDKKKMACFTREGFGTKSIKWCYYLDHQFQDWDMDEAIMREKYPEWARFFYEETNKPNIFFHGKNCFVMRWEDFDKYCTEMFGILFEHDKRFGITPDNFKEHGKLYQKSPYRWNNLCERQTRFNGYTAERIGHTWFLFNMDEVVPFPYVGYNKYFPEQNPVNELTGQMVTVPNKPVNNQKVIRVIRKQNPDNISRLKTIRENLNILKRNR